MIGSPSVSNSGSKMHPQKKESFPPHPETSRAHGQVTSTHSTRLPPLNSERRVDVSDEAVQSLRRRIDIGREGPQVPRRRFHFGYASGESSRWARK